MNVTQADRHRLEGIIADRSAPQKHVWRAKIILATAAEIMCRSKLFHPQAPKGTPMAGASSALDVPLYPDLRVLA